MYSPEMVGIHDVFDLKQAKGKFNLLNLIIYDFVVILTQLKGLTIILYQFQRLASPSIFINMY